MTYATDTDLLNMSNEELHQERAKLQERRDYILGLIFRNVARAAPTMLELFKEPKEIDMSELREAILFEYGRDEENILNVLRHLPNGNTRAVKKNDVCRAGFWLITNQWSLPLRLDFSLKNGKDFSLKLTKISNESTSKVLAVAKEI